MNKKVLQKCLQELQTSDPDISYIRGMIESIVDMLPEEHVVPVVVPQYTATASLPVNVMPNVKQEESDPIADAYTRGPVKL